VLLFEVSASRCLPPSSRPQVVANDAAVPTIEKAIQERPAGIMSLKKMARIAITFVSTSVLQRRFR
jgi:hypothetical protein